jgi:16S rRNA (adenine1518-N6/adenine1519-N6)-dimethyltransferase
VASIAWMTAASQLLGPAQVRQLARRVGLRPTKALGQNFVVDPNTIRRIVAAARLAATDIVVEVGPGLGSLTLGLLDVAAQVTAVELDPVLAGALPHTVAAFAPAAADRLFVVTADAARIEHLPGAAPSALVANLPYNVAVPVLLHLLELLPSLRTGLVMVQAEVADRLCARPGSRTYGVPSLKLAWYADAEPAGNVSRTVFWPAPNVDSGLVRLRLHPPPELPAGVSRSAVFAAVDAAFRQRRKTLRAALAGWAGSPGRAERVLSAAGVPPSARGETLDIAAFVRLAAAGLRQP